MINKQEDLILIQNSLDGNQVAQKILYDRYKKIIKSYLRSKYCNYSDLDDDVSEIIIKAFTNLHSFDSGKSQFKSWIISIAKNHMIDKWRNKSTTFTSSANNWYISNDCVYSGSVVISSDTVPSTFTITNTNSSDVTLSTSGLFNSTSYCSDIENSSSINYISNKLSSEDFTLLNMKYVEGYDYCEIGKEFNLTSSTVSNRVNYIKTKLKRDMQEIIEYF